MFFSHSKVIRARELAAAHELAKDGEALDRLLQAQDRAQLKAHRELEVQQKREDRAIRAAARKTQKALDKAQRGRDKLAKRAQKQLHTESLASGRKPRGRPPKRKQPQESVAVVIEPELGIVPEQPRSRTGRAIKRPRFFDDIQVIEAIERATAITMSYLSALTPVFPSSYNALQVMMVM